MEIGAAPLPPEYHVRKTGSRFGRVKEFLKPTQTVELNKNQALGALDLLSHHPSLTVDQEAKLRDWSNEFYSANGPTKGMFIMRSTSEGLRDLTHFNPHGSWQAAETEAAIKTLEKGTDFSIIDDVALSHPEIVPPELQYVLGLDGEGRIHEFAQALERGDKIAFLRVKEIPQDVHDALHFLIDELGGATSPVIDSVRKDEQLDPRKFDPKIREEIRDAQYTLRNSAHQLLQLKILSHNPENPASKALELEMNNTLDKHLDIPYAVARYTEHALRGDVVLAGAALGLSATVALGLSQVGLGTSDNVILEGIKLAIPVIAADMATNLSGAVSAVREDLPKGQKIIDMAKILGTRFRVPIAVGVFGSPLIGTASEYLQQGNHAAAAAVVLGAASLLPTWLTKKVSDRLYEHGDATSGKKEANAHPVQKSLMRGSIAAFAATSALGPAGLLTSALAVTGATEGVEPMVTAASAINEMRGHRKNYHRIFSDYPNKLFQQTIRNYSYQTQ